MNTCDVLHVLDVYLGFLVESRLHRRRSETLRRCCRVVVIDEQRITGEVPLTELFFTALYGTLRGNPLGLRCVTKLLSSNRAPEVAETDRVLHPADKTVADSCPSDSYDTTHHTDDRDTVESILVRARKDVKTSHEMHLSVGARSNTALLRGTVLHDQFI